MRKDKAGGNNNWFGQLGSWFAAPQPGRESYEVGSAEGTADTFAELRGDEGSAVYPVYLSIQNPYEVEGYESLTDERDDAGGAAAFRARLVAQGYDGVVVRESSTDGGDVRDDWVAFYPTQIKSAIGNDGNFDKTNPDIRRSAQRTPLGFYSALGHGNDTIKTNAAPAAGWKDAIKGLVNKGTVKADEVEWSGVNDWLDLQQGRVTKDLVAQYLAQGGVEVEESVLDSASSATIAVNREFAGTGYTVEANIDGQVDFVDPEGDAIDYDDLPARLQAIVDRQGNSESKYDEYQLKGGTNYREVLLTLVQKLLPSTPLTFLEAKHQMTFFQNPVEVRDQAGVFIRNLLEPWQLEEARAKVKSGEYKLTRVDLEAPDRRYQSKHWKEPNVLAHIRVNDRVTADGKRVLFVEELQSDWGQQGKTEGFASELDPALAQRVEELRQQFGNGYGPGVFGEDGKRDPVKREMLGSRLREAEDRLRAAKAGVPTAPFVAAQKFAVFKDGNEVTRTDQNGKEVKQRYDSLEASEAAAKKVGGEARDLGLQANTEGWLNLALKRIMVMAAEGGYDKVAFVTGEQSAGRYDLSEQVSKLEWDMSPVDTVGILRATDLNGEEVIKKAMKPDELADHVGKEVAQRLLDAPSAAGIKTIEGDGLKVGGQGMKTFYDKIVPLALKKLLPKVGGGQVEGVVFTSALAYQVQDDDGNLLQAFASRDVAEGFMRDGNGEVLAYKPIHESKGISGGPETQPGFDITPEMRAKVEGGLPLFSRQRNMFGQAVPLANWTAPTNTKLDNVIHKLQDKQIDTKRVVAAIEHAAGFLDDKWNPYLKEELYHGRAAKQTKDFASGELKPLLKDMQRLGVAIPELEEYLHNRHAEERNVQIARVNAAMPDGGSGIDTAAARAYLAGLAPDKRRDLQSLGKRVDDITQGTRSLLVQSGLETQDSINKWEQAYINYVPLFREDLDYGQPSTGGGTGQGYSVRGSASKRATGSSRPVIDILGNLVSQRERAIVRSEKTRVGTALWGLAVTNPNEDFWLAVDPNAVKDPAKTIQALINLGINPIDAQNIVKEPTQAYVDPKTGLATQRVNPNLRSADNVFAVRINGEEKYVFFNNNEERAIRMARALKNLDAPEMGFLLGKVFGPVSRYFSSINTQYNPIFGVVNLIRDTGGAAANLTTTAIADRKAEVLSPSNLAGAMRGIYTDVRAERKGNPRPPGSWAQLWQEFQDVGGQTGYRDNHATADDRAKTLQSEINQISEGKLKGAGRAMFNWLSDYNETLENAVRLSAYKAGIEKGLSKEQAASIAKNLTVNFNRKGEIGAQAGALYAFFNASVQGTARLAETMAGPAGKTIMAGGLLLGVAQAMLLAAAGFRDDEPPDFVKERSLVIPTGNGKYVAIPLPLGLNMIPNTGRVLTEWALAGGKNPGKRMGQIFGSILTSFNPIGGGGWSVQTLAPTAIDPLVALGENRDWTGKKIAKEDRSGTAPTPGFSRAKENASWFSMNLAKFLNLASGGTSYKPGAVSPTPDQLDYLIGQATGGVGRELLKIGAVIETSITGEELPTYKVPVLGRFYGDTKDQSAVAAKFYANVTEINKHEAEIKGRQKNHEGGVGEYKAANPEARLVGQGNEAERAVADLNKRKRELLEKGRSKESIKMVEQQIQRKMERLNAKYEAVTQ